MKVLVCDDEENIRNLLKRYFALFSIDCLVAENGLSAKRMNWSISRCPGLTGWSSSNGSGAKAFRCLS